MDTTKLPVPPSPIILFSIFLLPLSSCQCQLCPRSRGIVGHPQNRFKSSVAREGEVMHVPDGGGGNFGQYPEGGTSGVARKGYPTK